MRKGFSKPSLQDKIVDTFVSTAIRHVARKTIYAADHYVSYLEKDLTLTSLRCESCFKLCRYNYNNTLYDCSHCRKTSQQKRGRKTSPK